MEIANLDHIVILAKLAMHPNCLKLYYEKQLVELEFNRKSSYFQDFNVPYIT